MCTKRILTFCYRMDIAFSLPAAKHQFTLRMLPCQDARQKIAKACIRLVPECAYANGEDAFGNQYIYGEIVQEHTHFGVEVCGIAEIDQNCLTAPENTMAALAPYRYPSHYTKVGEEIKEYYREHGKGNTETQLAFTERLLHQIYQDMVYCQGVTDIYTTAEQAMAGRTGVCQDYAHIMISLCRIADIPSRYVVGMMQGEGFSHAWVEVCIDGYWHGMDPTNNRVVDDTYIKISHGRDYQDCIVNRGVFRGGGEQTQQVQVIVNVEEGFPDFRGVNIV